MKTLIKTVTAALTLSIISVGLASAMIPQVDLTQNLFPDQGISSQVLSDIDDGVLQPRRDATTPGLSDLSDNPEPLTQYYQQLVGKHLI